VIKISGDYNIDNIKTALSRDTQAAIIDPHINLVSALTIEASTFRIITGYNLIPQLTDTSMNGLDAV